ncbi:MAG: RNA 2',3'-cyclic phosphodiesterase [Candidatus Korobacteraceae bacterium]
MRLFIALDIDPDIRERIATFRDQMRALAPDVRWVGPETFHVTLQFLGETKKLDEVRHALQPVNSAPIQLAFRGSGFFPNSKAPRVFWVGIDGDENLQTLATEVVTAMHPLGFESDASSYMPHLTLARSGSGRPRPVPGEPAAPGLQRVRDAIEKIPSPDFGTMTAHQFFLYESYLSPAGARYEKRATFPLRKSLGDLAVSEEKP